MWEEGAPKRGQSSQLRQTTESQRRRGLVSLQHLPAWADNSTHDLTLTLWAHLSSRTVKTIKIHEPVYKSEKKTRAKLAVGSEKTGWEGRREKPEMKRYEKGSC